MYPTYLTFAQPSPCDGTSCDASVASLWTVSFAGSVVSPNPRLRSDPQLNLKRKRERKSEKNIIPSLASNKDSEIFWNRFRSITDIAGGRPTRTASDRMYYRGIAIGRYQSPPHRREKPLGPSSHSGSLSLVNLQSQYDA